MPVRNACQRRGFTLVELLVVITIIGILVTLVTVAGYRALISTRQWTISVEVNSLENAITTYKAKHQDFPPDFSNATIVASHLGKLYPRSRETPASFATAIANLDPSEALVFWLGGGLFDNPEFPLTGPGQRKIFFDFKKERLVDLDGDGRMSYVPAYGTQPAPYVYFDSRSYSAARFPTTAAMQATYGIAYPYKTDAPRSNAPFAAATAANEWEEPDKFQIISAGLDGNYGTWATAPTVPSAPGAAYKYYPSGAVADPQASDGNRGSAGIAYSKPDRDNVTSFAEGALEAKLP